jgi:16S rRNA (uracil1498-N3)-methyltransferase
VESGQIYEISDNGNAYLAEVASVSKSRVLFAVKERIAPSPPPLRMVLMISIIKFDHFEWILEKGTELGVERFVPVIAARTEKGLERAVEKRSERWLRILQESSQQCRRDRLPLLDGLLTFRQALKVEGDCRFFLDEQTGTPPILKVLPETRSATDVVVLLLGPEGGWTDAERSDAAKWQRVSIGTQILRAETAAIAGAAIVSAAWQGA